MEGIYATATPTPRSSISTGTACWGLSSRASDIEFPDTHACSSADDYDYSMGREAEDLLSPADLLGEEEAPQPIAAPTPRQHAASLPTQPQPLSVSPRLSIQRKEKSNAKGLSSSEDGFATLTTRLPVPAPVPEQQVPPARSTSAGGSSSCSSGDDSAGSSNTTTRRSRRTLSRLCKSPDGPKFASGAYKNAPPPAALPPPPVEFCGVPQMRRSPSCSSPVAGRTFASDPAIIACAAAPAPQYQARPCAATAVSCEAMTSQLIQLLGIKAQ